MSAISIPKGSIKLAGLVFKPATLTGNSKAPGIVIIHPGGGVKEQTASVYAQKLSQQGYVAVCYDASHQGDSEGLPRFLEDPAARTSDTYAVADYLERLEYVDGGRISILGICAGGAYAVAAAKSDHRFRAVATVNAFNIGEGTRLGFTGEEDAADKVAVLDQVAQALRAEAQQGLDPATFPIVPPTAEANAGTKDGRDTYEYYFTARGQHPNSQNKLLLRSVPRMMAFDPWQFADLYLTQPTLIIAGEKAGTRWCSEKLFRLLDGKNKGVKMTVVPGAGHIDLYDRDEYVNPAVEEIAAFFAKC